MARLHADATIAQGLYTVNPWDRKAGEKMMWYSRFIIYRELGPERSLLGTYNVWRNERQRKAATGCGITWTRAAKTWHWRERAEKWDHYQQVRRMQAEQEEIDVMNKRHLQAAMGLQAAGTRSLQAILAELRRVPTEDDPRPVKHLSNAEIRRFLSEGIDLERTTRGLPTEMIAIMGAIMGMSDEELLKAYGGVVPEEGEDESSEPD
jgi:hypothetical protein